jgi:hypothetical protein
MIIRRRVLAGTSGFAALAAGPRRCSHLGQIVPRKERSNGDQTHRLTAISEGSD